METLKRGLLSLTILSFSLLLFTGIGLGEAYRTYSKLKIEGVYALGETVKSVVDSFLGAGIPLGQFVGFDNVASLVLEVDESIQDIQIVDTSGRVVFSSGNESDRRAFRPSTKIASQKRYRVDENERFYRIGIPLENKFETAGVLQLHVLKQHIHATLQQSFRGVFTSIGVAMLLFLVLISVIHRKRFKNQKLWFSLSYTLAVLMVAVSLLVSLIAIYYGGIQAKTQNLATSLAHKLSYIPRLDLDIASFKGIDQLLESYRTLNPEIRSIVLQADGEVLVQTSQSVLNDQAGAIRHAQEFNGHRITVAVEKGVVYSNLWRSSKSFLILFVAALFMSALFLNLLFALQRKSPSQGMEISDRARERLLALVKPLFFLGVFAEALFASFLPQYFEDIALRYALGANGASFLFSAFFVAYAVVLLPSAQYCQKKGEKKLLIGSIGLFGLSCLGMAFGSHYILLMGMRILAGLSQGALFMAVQSYLLRAAPAHKKTQSMAILIIQYNGGRIAGTALGALAVSYLQAWGVFLSGGILSLLLLVYVLKYMPRLETLGLAVEPGPVDAGDRLSFFSKFKHVLKDLEHLKTTFLIGVNAKLVMIGVVGFALPLVMDRQAFSKEDIGLVLMLYSIGVLISSIYSSRLVDRTGDTRKILFRGNQGSGLGLVCIGIIGLPCVHLISANLLVIFGTLILGLSHGLIAAPILTHISNTRTSSLIGRGPSISVFRIFERAGNILGPLLVGQLLVMSHYNPLVISMIGGFVLLCGLIFLIKSLSTRTAGVLLILLCLLAVSSEGRCRSFEQWFRFTEQKPAAWEVRASEADDLQFTLTPKPAQGTVADTHIFVVIPKKSSAYVTSLETVLQSFAAKRFYPEFTVLNYAQDEGRGRKILEVAVEQEVDLIFAMGSLSIDFLFNHFQEAQIPVVSICAKDPVMMGYIEDYDASSGNHFAFTSLNVPVKVQMVFLQELIPDLQQIGILYARNNASAVLTQADPLRAYAEGMGIEVLDVAVDNRENARQEIEVKLERAVQQMKADDPECKRSVFYVTGSTSVFSNFDVINRHADRIPVVGASPSMVRGRGEPGALLSIGVGFENNAQLASIYAEKILKNQISPGELPVGVITPPDIAINFRLVRDNGMKIPYNFFELANLIFNYQGEKVKSQGMIVYND